MLQICHYTSQAAQSEYDENALKIKQANPFSLNHHARKVGYT